MHAAYTESPDSMIGTNRKLQIIIDGAIYLKDSIILKVKRDQSLRTAM